MRPIYECPENCVWAQKQLTIAQESPHYNLITIQRWNYFQSIPTNVITVPKRYRRTDRRTIYTVASPMGKNRETQYHRYYRHCRYFNLKLPVYCRFKQVNGITTATEITEDLMPITESTVIMKNVHSCWIVRMSRWTTETDRRHRLTLTLNVT